MIGLSSSSFYYNPKQSREEKEKADLELRDKIEKIQQEIPRSGYRQVLDQLRKANETVGERRVRRVMKKFSLWAEVKRAWIKTTDSDHDYKLYPNLISGMKVTGTIPMKLDSFYISLLSEKYKNNKSSVTGMIKANLNGLTSNIKASKSGDYSSLIYIVRK